MKRIALYFGIAAALVASCSVQEEDFKTPQQDDVIYYASFEQPAEEGTRVYANEDLLLRWTVDDRISIFNKLTYNQEYKFTGQTGANAGGFKKVDNDEFVTGNPISHVVSVYPYQESNAISESEVISVTLPAEQTYAESTFGLGANTMVSVSEDNILLYKNVGGYLKIKLYGEGVFVSSITLRGNNGEHIAGTAIVTMPSDGVPSVQMASDATTKVTLTCPSPVHLGTTEETCSQFWFVLPPVTFNYGFTIRVDEATGEFFEKSTTKSITIGRNNLSTMSPIEVNPSTVPYLPVPEAVDMGLSVKWSSFNLGASKQEEFGDYYAWGETEPYYEPGYSQSHYPVWKIGKEAGYSWASYQWCNGSETTLTKYNFHRSWGVVDGKRELGDYNYEDDVARQKLGANWRIPSITEWLELKNNCTWTWITRNGINGYLVTATNGNSIFLPAAGWWTGTTVSSPPSLTYNSRGYYWACRITASLPSDAGCFVISSGYYSDNSVSRCLGHSVRPVYAD